MKKNKKKEINRSFLQNLKSTYKYAKEGKKYLIYFLIVNILLTVISVLGPILGAKRLVALTNGTYDKLLLVVFFIFGLELLRNICHYLYGYTFQKFYYVVGKNIKLNLAKECLKIKQDDLNNNSSGIFIDRINNDSDNVSDIFSQLIDYLSAIVGNLGILISIFIINIYIGLAYLFFIVFYTIYNNYFNKIVYEKNKIHKKSKEKTIGFTSELVRGTKDIKILNSEKSFLYKAEEYIDDSNKTNFDRQMTKRKYWFIGGNIKDLFDVTISIMFIVFLKSDLLSVEMVLIIFNYHYQLTNTASWIEQIFDIVKQYNLAANRIFGILEEDEFEKEHFGTKKIDNFKGNIEFKDVVFSYKDDKRKVIDGMNFKIKANQTVGFVGPSGAGKSTIFNLISKLNEVDSGSITFDGININELNKDSIRGNLSVISQNAYIFNMSILDNLKVVKKDATLKEIKEACKLACLDDFINGLPNKYNTIVGEGGVTLSGGQKQRLAIARALLLKTEIMLFDEATSALDNETQAKIQQAINNLKGEYTVLIIAHRLSTIMDCDNIFIVDDGKVVDHGTHKKLLRSSIIYKKLYKKESEASK